MQKSTELENWLVSLLQGQLRKKSEKKQYTRFMTYCGYVVVIYLEEQFVSLLRCCHCLEET
jgi:hypothetical protein